MVYRALEEDCCSNPGAEALTRVMSQWQESPPQPLHGWLQPKKEGRSQTLHCHLWVTLCCWMEKEEGPIPILAAEQHIPCARLWASLLC